MTKEPEANEDFDSDRVIAPTPKSRIQPINGRRGELDADFGKLGRFKALGWPALIMSVGISIGIAVAIGVALLGMLE